jgi:iron complex transport system substrate-binding protein
MARRTAAARRRTAAAVLAFAPIVLPGCGEAARRSPAPSAIVSDGLGRRVAIPRPARRIVSLAPSVTETALALGLGDRLVGVSDFCALPPGLDAVARVGGLLNPSLEGITALRPDLLIATTSGNDPGLAEQAEALGLPLYILHTPDVRRTLEAIVSLAAALGEPETGRRVARDLERRLEAVAERVAGRRPPRVLYVVWAEPLVVPGGPALVTDALRRAGGDPVSAGMPAAWPTLALEAAIRAAPEVILTTPKNADLAGRLRADPAWAAIPAVRSGRVHLVSDAIERPGPGLAGAIEEAARTLHPEAFAGAQK